MASPSYRKPALTVDQQLQRLIGRGMKVANPTEAKHYLQTLNYYRLAAYWLGMEADHATHQFAPDASSERVVELYVFDREFRLLLLDAIERIEVAVRTQLAYQLGHKYGTHPHLQAGLFKPRWNHATNLNSLEQEAQRSKENFIRHLLQNYAEPVPPVLCCLNLYRDSALPEPPIDSGQAQRNQRHSNQMNALQGLIEEQRSQQDGRDRNKESDQKQVGSSC